MGWYQLTQRDGLRCSTAVAYLHPALERPNLTLQTDAHVTRLLLDGTRAVGVEIDQGNELKEIHGGEVILSAGTYQSPQILLLSGIGPAEDLEMARSRRWPIYRSARGSTIIRPPGSRTRPTSPRCSRTRRWRTWAWSRPRAAGR